MKKQIRLYSLNQLALILSEPSGIYYYNQVGGHACYQEEAEGILVFVEDDCKNLYKRITEYSIEDHGRWLTELKEEDADHFDSLFRWAYESLIMRFALRIDRTKLKESKEAWVHVILEHDIPEYRPMPNEFNFTGFHCKNGILTWDNSD